MLYFWLDLNISYILDNITDCPDGSDELGCDDDFYKCNEYKGTVHAIL